MSGLLALFSRSSARCTASGAGICRGAGSTTLISEFLPASRPSSAERASPAGRGRRRPDGRTTRGADRARDADADVLGVQHAERRLAQRLGDRELVHLLVVALLQVDDLALARAADEDHRKAVGRRVGERSQAVEEAGRGHGQADAGLLREEAGDRRGIAGVLLVAERDHAQAFFCMRRVRSVIGMPGRPKIVSMPFSFSASMTS